MKKLLFVIMMFASSFGVMAQTHHWTPMTGNQYNMTVYGVIVIDGVQQAVTTLELGAFCGEECRASEFPMEYMGDYVVPMTIRSNAMNGETITFKLYDHSINEELDLECQTTVNFEANGIIIDPSNWFQFEFNTTTEQHYNTPGNWSDATNWGGTLPDATAHVSIDADCTIDIDVEVEALTIADGVTVTVGVGYTLIVNGDLVNTADAGLIIKDGAQVVNASVGVHASAEKNITAYTAKDSNGWHLISSSVNDMPIAGSDFIVETYDLFRYDETTPAWENYRQHYNTDFMTFEKGRGYLYANSNTISPAFVGTLNNDAVTYTVTYTSNKASSGINIIGNPFPHNIYKGAGGAIDDNHLSSGYYELTYDGEWVAHTFDEPILPGQGILVVTSSTADITIAKTNAEATAETSAKGDVKRLKIKVSGNGRQDRAFAYFSEGNGLVKMDNFSSSAAAISIQDKGQKYAIAHVGEECEEMDVIFKNNKNGYYTISFEGTEGFTYLHLIDKITGEDVDMLLDNEYKFHAYGNENENRFKVICRNNTGIGEEAETTTFAYVADGNIVVSGDGFVEIIDMTGRVVNTMYINGVETMPASSGVFVVRIVNGNNVKTQKIIVR